MILFQINFLYSQSLRYKHYTTADGLPHNVGYDIHQDRQGFIWLAMDNGLSKFDGQTFKNFNVDDGLNGPFVITLSEDTEGKIWTGVHLKGGNRISNDTISKIIFPHIFADAIFVHHKSGDWLVNDNTHNVHRTGNIVGIQKNSKPNEFTWVSFFHEENKTKWRILSKAESHKDSLSFLRTAKPNNKPTTITLRQSSRGDIFVFTPDGVLLYDRDSIFIPAPSFYPKEPIIDFAEDSAGNYWFLGKKDLYKLSKKRKLQSFLLPKYLHESIQLKVINDENVFLLSESREELYKINLKNNEFEDIAADLNLKPLISFIETDREGDIWISTMGDGIYCIFNHDFKNYSDLEGLSNVYINAIREAPNGDIFVCTLKGMNKIRNGKVESVPWFQKLYGRYTEVYDIIPLENGSFILSTSYGYSDLVSPEQESKIIFHPAGPKRYNLFAKDSIVLLQYSMREQKRIFDFFELNSNTVKQTYIYGLPKFLMTYMSIYPDIKAGAYWLGTQTGLVFLKNGQAKPYPLPEELENTVFNDITKDPKGNIWFAGEKGVLTYDGEKMVHFNKEKKWPNFQCRQIIFDKNNNMWMASPNGLYLWDGQQLLRYTIFDGIISNDIRHLFIDRKETLWLGTSSGVSKISLPKIPIKSQAPNVILSGVLLDQHEVELNSIKEITHEQNLNFNFFTLPFSNTDNLVFSYQLLPDSTWQSTPNRSLEFRNLQSGSYRLNVKARKSNSDWSEILSIPFSVLPPWWKSVWAYTLLGLFALGVGVFLNYLWAQNAKKKNQIAYEMAQLKLQVLQSQLNPHFIFNALNVIQGYILENDIDSSNTYLERFSSLMRKFLESSKKNEILLSDEIELINLFVEMEQLCYEGRFDYTLSVQEKLRVQSILIPSMLLQPFVENAIHHGLLKKEGKGKLSIQFEEKGNYLFCTILDDGIGRAKSQEIQQKSTLNYISRGMQIVSERLRMQNYLERENISIKVSDLRNAENEASGTQVVILCPIKLIDTSRA